MSMDKNWQTPGNNPTKTNMISTPLKLKPDSRTIDPQQELTPSQGALLRQLCSKYPVGIFDEEELPGRTLGPEGIWVNPGNPKN